MREHFAHLPDFLYRALHKLDLYVGVGAGIVFLVIAFLLSIGEQAVVTGTVAIAAILVFFSGYSVYREERQMRTERERNIRVTARAGSWAINHPDPGHGRASINVRIFWEVWVSREAVATDKLALNLIYVYDKPWWQFWKKTRFPQKGIPQKGRETTQYRVMIDPNDNQPFKGDAIFEYIGESAETDPHWLLELVLITGMPAGEHRIPIFIDYDEMRSRGTYPPL